MNILVLAPIFPYPANDGSRIRVANFLKYLSVNNKLTLLALGQDKLNKSINNNLIHDWCNRVAIGSRANSKAYSVARWLLTSKPYVQVRHYEKSLNNLVSYHLSTYDYDVIFVNFLSMLQYIPNNHARRALIVLDQHNNDELWYQSFADRGGMAGLFGRINIARLRRTQCLEYKKVDLCLSVSERDAEHTKESACPPPEIIVARNGVDLDYFRPVKNGQYCENTILFCGSMDVYMNQDAVLYFCQQILPGIRKKIPDTKLFVVGRSPPQRIRRLAHDDAIVVTGTVEDVRPFYERAKVAVAPFRIGGGTKLKIVEAMAMRVPVVSTTQGFSGIEAEPDKHLLVADTPDAFADAVVRVLKEVPCEMIEAAAELAATRYSWKEIVTSVERKIKAML